MLPATELEQNQVTSTSTSTQQVSGAYAPLPDGEHDGLVTAHAVQTIRAEQLALYNFWHDVSSIPLWQEHVVSVTPLTEHRSHWVMGNPEDAEGKRVEFDSEIYEDVPGSRIAWRSISGDVEQSGSVTFEPAVSGRGTLVTLIETIKVPFGALGNAAAAIAKRSPRQTVIENLRHFKQLAETGEIPSVKGQPHGPRGISGGFKEWLYGETNPTPPGVSETIK
jgi:uncharacterized membrane protein